MPSNAGNDFAKKIAPLLQHPELLTLRTAGGRGGRALRFSKVREKANGFRLEHKSRSWEFALIVRKKTSQFWRGTLTGKYLGKKPGEFSLQMKFPLRSDGVPRWMVPGVLYKENRPADCIRRFPYPRYDYHGADAEKFESSYWAFRSDRCPSPAVICWTACRPSGPS